jgi:hypothetical protein
LLGTDGVIGNALVCGQYHLPIYCCRRSLNMARTVIAVLQTKPEFFLGLIFSFL